MTSVPVETSITDVVPVEAKITDVVGQPYRAKDITMGATVDIATRTVFLTGAIDTNEHDILVRVELPEAGIWNVVKAETNLTDATWYAWQITLGEGTQIVPELLDRANMCQQYTNLYVTEDRERFCFYGGEIRPGEPILKQFTLDTKIPRIVMSHLRHCVASIDDDQVIQGFDPKPPVESWVTPRLL